MGGLQLTLAVLALAASVKGQGPPCWYDSMCPYTEQDTSLHIPATEANLEARMDWCYAACGTAETANPGDCAFFTVFTNRGVSSCKLLTSCQDADADADCLAQGNCNSGPRDCTAPSTTVCDKLPASVEPAIPWQCDTVDPYSTPVPDGETCFLSCDGRVTASGVQAVILSTCNDGSWSPSIPSEGAVGDYPALPASLPMPDAAEADQLACGCADEPMAWDHDNDVATAGIVYDPNTLPGKKKILLLYLIMRLDLILLF